jgi:hypothetical protein
MNTSQAIVGTCQGVKAALAFILIFISTAYFTHATLSSPQSKYFLSSEDLGLTRCRAQPLFDRILTWMFVYGGAAAVFQLLYFAVVGYE